MSSISVCTGLPKDWIGVKTETEFPVDTGTTITVSCQEGYINTGSKIVTCNTYLYQDFQYDTKPNCSRKPSKSQSSEHGRSCFLAYVQIPFVTNDTMN